MEAPTFGSRNECPHFVKVCSVRASTNTWALSIWSADRRPGREDAVITQAGGEHVSIPRSPAVPKELLAELRSLLSNKPAAQGLCFLVLFQTLSFLKQEPYLTQLCLVLFIPTRHLSRTSSNKAPVMGEMEEWNYLTSDWYKWLESTGEPRASCFCSYCQFFITWAKNMQHTIGDEGIQNFLEPKRHKVWQNARSQKGRSGEWFRLGGDKWTSHALSPLIPVFMWSTL